MKHLIFIIVLLSLSLSCTKESSPESVLESFVNYRFSSKQDMEKILAYTTGNFRSNLENFILLSQDLANQSDESDSAGIAKVSEFLDMSKLRKKSFKIVLKNCTDSSESISQTREICHMTYIVSYDHFDRRLDEVASERDFHVEVRKIATLEREVDQEWKISDINNVKTHIDSKKNIQP